MASPQGPAEAEKNVGGNVRRVDTKPSPAPSPRHAEEGPSVIRRIHAMPDLGGQPLPRSDPLIPKSALAQRAKE